MTNLFILDEDEFYLKSVTQNLKDKGLEVIGSSDWGTAINDIKHHCPEVVILQRKSGSMRKSLIVQMSEHLLMDKCRIYLSNDQKMEELDVMLAHSLGFEKIIERPLLDAELEELFPSHFGKKSEEIKKAA